MSKLLAISRMTAFWALTVALYTLFIVVRPFLAGSSRLRWGWRNRIFRAWARGTAGILNMHIHVQGSPPRAPFLLVSNHLSYIDIVVLAAHCDAMFVAKREVAGWPLLGPICRGMGTIFVDRTCSQSLPAVVGQIERALQEQRSIVLFAEGTSTAGAEVLPFNSSLLAPAARAGFPVSYASLSYRTPPDQMPAHLSVCWWGAMTFLDHLYRLFQLPEFEAMLVFGTPTIQADDRKLLARRLHTAVVQQFTPVMEESNRTIEPWRSKNHAA